MNTKKVAIFGDSYADDLFCKVIYKNKEKSWVDCIRDTGLYTVDNFSQRGASLWWCFQQFLEHREKYDRVIFLITFPNRITIPATSTLTICKHHQPYNTELHLKFAKGEKYDQFKLVRDYYINIHDDERELYFHNMLVEKIQQLCPDALLYPCGERSISNNNDLSLFSIMKQECVSWGKFDVSFRLNGTGMEDIRMCHLTEENNILFGQLMLDRLAGNHRIFKIDDVVLTSRPKEYYLKNARWGI